MNYELVIDADSMLFTSQWRFKDDPTNIEGMYLDFCGQVCEARSAVFDKFGYNKGDTIDYEIVFTRGSNFRYDIFPAYKAKRPPTDPIISQLKDLVAERLPKLTIVPNHAEADDYVISRNCLVAAIDKDVLQANLNYSYNYSKKVWIEPNIEADIEYWYLYQALMGDTTDGIPGAPGIGKVKAAPIARSLVDGLTTWEDYCQHFESPEMATTCVQLVRMDQWDHQTEELNLWTPDQLIVYDPDDI